MRNVLLAVVATALLWGCGSGPDGGSQSAQSGNAPAVEDAASDQDSLHDAVEAGSCLFEWLDDVVEVRRRVVDGMAIEQGSSSASVLGEVDMEAAGAAMIRLSSDADDCLSQLSGLRGDDSVVGEAIPDVDRTVAALQARLRETGDLLLSPRYEDRSWRQATADAVNALPDLLLEALEATDELRERYTDALT